MEMLRVTSAQRATEATSFGNEHRSNMGLRNEPQETIISSRNPRLTQRRRQRESSPSGATSAAEFGVTQNSSDGVSRREEASCQMVLSSEGW